jgi:hypothetical protein
MNRSIICLLAIALTSLPLSATEDPVEGYVPEVVTTKSAEPSPPPSAEASLNLSKVVVEKRAAPATDAAAQLGERGGFWWLVGVVVVAGVILAVIL